MDQNKTGLGSPPDNQNLFRPEEVITSDQAPAQVVLTQPLPSPSEPTQQPSPANNTDNNVNWTASEFIDHYKSVSWYLRMMLGALLVGAIVWFLTRSTFSTILVLLGILLLAIYASHKPRQLAYGLSDQGLTIGDRHHLFNEFRSFSVVSDEAFSSIELTPLKRFAMYTTIYFDPADSDNIIGLLSRHLPLEEPRNDFVEQLMHRLHF